MDNSELAFNLLQLLQVRPERYRAFGLYWWPVKALLKRYYNTDQLYLLGDYRDPEGLARLPALAEADLLQRALIEQQRNLTFPPADPARVYDADGEPYRIYDQDAGF